MSKCLLKEINAVGFVARKDALFWQTMLQKANQIIMTFTTNLDIHFVEAGLGRQTVYCLVDSGAMISCISRNVLQNCLPNAKIFNSRLTSITGVCGETHPVLGETSISLRLGDLELRQNFTILGTLHAKVILGIDFIRSHKVKTDFGEMT